MLIPCELTCFGTKIRYFLVYYFVRLLRGFFMLKSSIDFADSIHGHTQGFLRGVMGLNFKLVKNDFKLVTGPKKLKF